MGNMKNLVVYLDKHQAHKSPKLRKYFAYKNVDFQLFPPNCSFINPIEVIWGAFKHKFR